MTDSTATSESAPKDSLPPPEAPVIKPVRRGPFSPVWIIPLVAAALGLWLVGRHYAAQGPEISVWFENAEGLIAGKTPVLCRSVPIGTVSEIELADDSHGVVVRIAMTRPATRLLVEE